MAETKAEDEDDGWGFGDFTFSSSFLTQTDKNNNKDDDEWGDFVESPLQSTTALAHNQSSPNQSFSGFSSSDVNLQSGVGSEGKNAQWVKLKGALPLSIFGEEEEEESGVADPSAGDGKDSFSDNKSTGNLKNESNSHPGVGINDIIANLYSQNHQIKAKENGANLNSNGSNLNVNETNSNQRPINWDSAINFSGLNPDLYNQSQETKNENGPSSNFGGLNFEFNGSNMNLNGTIPVSRGVNFDMNGSIMNLSGLNSTSGRGNIDISTNLSNQSQEIKFENELISNPNGVDSNSKVSSSHFGGWDLNFNRLDSNADPVSANEEFDGDDDGWEFKDAYSESKVENGNDKGNVALEILGFQVQSEAEMGQEMQVQELPDLTKFSSEFENGSHGQIDLFAMSNGFSSKSHETDIGLDFKPGTVAQKSFLSDSYLQSEQKDMKNGLNSHPLAENADSDETFGEFEAAVLDTGSKQKEEPKVNNLSASEGEVLTFNGRNQGNEIKSEICKGPMPLSIFGDEELETDASLNIQDAFMSKPPLYSGNVHSRVPSLSINDLLSNFYSQDEPIPSVDSVHRPTENGLDSTNRVPSSDLVDGDDDFDDVSCEFKDAVSQMRTKNETSLHSAEDGGQIFSTKPELNTYVDFYCKLKDELCLVARCHLDNLKKAQSTAALSGEVAKVAALNEEIQDACKELHQENIMYKEANPEDPSAREIHLKEFVEVLSELKFQVLDSEFELSRKLSLAEKDLKSAIELIKHATAIMKILTLVSTEEQSNYVSTWSKMFSICAQELKHGACIWKQSLEKNVQSRILSEPQGKRFIFALAEIYRVVLVLGASVKLYKPWILSSSVNSTSIYALLEECLSLWSSSGLEEALQSIFDLTGSEYYGTLEALLASIKRIRNIDALALKNYVFAQQESVCMLSGLTTGLMPDMKMVGWDGEHYFLTLANLWANLISCDPPKLPRIKVG